MMIYMCDSWLKVFFGVKKTPKYYESFFNTITENGIADLKSNYTIIDVDWLNKTLVESKMFANEYFIQRLHKKQIIYEMLDFYLNHKDKAIYKKTDYLCDETEKVCICNVNADNFRKIYDGVNYEPNLKYISWCKRL